MLDMMSPSMVWLRYIQMKMAKHIERSRQSEYSMAAHSELLLPPPTLANCIAVGIFRDTLGAALSDRDRLNYFPASPLFAVSRVFDGQLHMASGLANLATLRAISPIPQLLATPPQDRPVCSWSPAGVRAITIGFYPDAWTVLGGQPEGRTVPDAFEHAIMGDLSDLGLHWDRVCDALASVWDGARAKQGSLPGWTGSHRVADWAR
jgi:hypothetical protein